MEEEDVSKLNVCERALHKKWKVRVDVFEELVKTISRVNNGKDEIFADLASYLPKFIADSNAAAQEKAIEMLITYFQRVDSPERYLLDVLSPLCEKALTGKPSTKANAQNLLILLMEVSNTPDVVVDTLLKNLSHKSAKIPIACLQVLNSALKGFGTKAISPKPIVKALPELFENADASVRSEAINILVELYRWIGPAVRPTIDNLRSAQKTDVENLIKDITAGQAQPELFTRVEAAKRAKLAASNSNNNNINNSNSNNGNGLDGKNNNNGKSSAQHDNTSSNNTNTMMDPYDMADPVDILSKIKDADYQQLTSTKWVEKKDKLEEILNLASTPKLAGGDYSELVQILKRCLNDANVNVLAKAISLSAQLAIGLRKEFSFHARILLPGILDKLKEKKAVVLEPTHKAIQAFYSHNCLLLVDTIDDILPAFTNKIPNARTEWLVALERLCRTIVPKPALSKALKQLCDATVKLLDDPTPEVRDAACRCFAAYCDICGEKIPGPYVDKLDKPKADKIKEYRVGNNNTNAATATAAAAAAAASTVTSTAATVPTAAISRFSASSSAATTSKAKIQTSATATTKSSTSNNSNNNNHSKNNNNNNGKSKNGEKSLQQPAPVKVMSEEECESWIIENISAEAIKDPLASKNWKDRLTAMDALLDYVKNQLHTVASDAIVALVEKTPSWKEANAQVIGKMFELLTMLCSVNCEKRITQPVAQRIIPFATEKIGDIKLQKPSATLLTGLSEAVTASFVFSELFQPALTAKNPKTHSEICDWMATAIEEFGAKTCGVPPLINFLKTTLESVNPQVKKNATKCLVGLRLAVGAGIRDFIADIKPALLTAIEQEFAKYEGQEAPAPTRFVIQPKNSTSSSSLSNGNSNLNQDNNNNNINNQKSKRSNDGGGGGGDDDDILPRSDISNSITDAVLSNLGGTNWKERQEAMNQIEGFINGAAKRINSNNLTPLLTALKARLTDSNKNLCEQALQLFSLLSEAAGKGITQYSKLVLPALLMAMTDKKASVRSKAVACLDIWCGFANADILAFYLAAGLSNESPDGRKEILTWLLNHSAYIISTCSSDEMKNFIKPCISALEDKSSEIRSLAEKVTVIVMTKTSYAAVREGTKSLKPASSMVIVPILDKCRAAINSNSAPTQSSTTSTSTTTTTIAATTAAVTVANNSSKNQSTTSSSPAPSTITKKLSQTMPTISKTITTPTTTTTTTTTIANAKQRSNNIPQELKSQPKLASTPPPSAAFKKSNIIPSENNNHENNNNNDNNNNKPASIEQYQLKESNPFKSQSKIDSTPTKKPSVSQIPQPQSRIPKPNMNLSTTTTTTTANGNIPSSQLTNNNVPRGSLESYLNLINSTDLSKSSENSASDNNNINNNNNNNAVESLKHICFILQDDEDQVIQPHLRLLVSLVSEKLMSSYANQSSRVFKHALVALLRLFSRNDLPKAITRDQVQKLLKDFFYLLSQKEKMTILDNESQSQGSTLRSLNQVTTKLLENSDQTRCYSALLQMLRDVIPMGDDKSATHLLATNLELTLNSLIIITKQLPENIKRLDVDTVLYDIHLFLVAHPPNSWRGQQDMPLRTVKTVLNELVKLKGDGIRSHLSRLPVDNYPIILSYLDLMIKQEASRMALFLNKQQITPQQKQITQQQLIQENSSAVINVTENTDPKIVNNVSIDADDDTKTIANNINNITFYNQNSQIQVPSISTTVPASTTTTTTASVDALREKLNRIRGNFSTTLSVPQ